MHAENNGFALVERLIDERPDGLRQFNFYEVEGSPDLVVTFVTSRCGCRTATTIPTSSSRPSSRIT